MFRAAIIQVTETSGNAVLVPVELILDVQTESNKTKISYGNTSVFVTETVAAIKSAIDTKWSEFLNADAGLPTSAISGTYTPTLTNVANVAASTAYECQYMRVGNTVSVSGKVDVDPTLAVATQLGISLPIASNFGAAEDCAGTAAASAIVSESAAILADTTNDRAEMNWITTSLANHAMYFSFKYQVI